jgi:hypothetical protein
MTGRPLVDSSQYGSLRPDLFGSSPSAINDLRRRFGMGDNFFSRDWLTATVDELELLGEGLKEISASASTGGKKIDLAAVAAYCSQYSLACECVKGTVGLMLTQDLRCVLCRRQGL